MGIILSIFKLLIEYFTRDDKTKICILGPASAGKTTFLFYYNYKEKVFTIPTNGYNSEIHKFKKKDFILWDVGASHVRNWPAFIEGADFIFFVIDSSDIQSIHSGRELLYQIYFGKRFRTFFEQFKERENERKKLYFYEEEQEDMISYNGEDYLNLIEEESDYEMTLKKTKMESDGTDTEKTSNDDFDNQSSKSESDINEKKNFESKEITPNVDLITEQDMINDEDVEYNKDDKKNKRKRNKKKKVQVHIEMSNKFNETENSNLNSPTKYSKTNSRKTSNEKKNGIEEKAPLGKSEEEKEKNPIELFNKCLKNKPLLIIANKQDRPQSYSTEDLAKILGLYYFKDVKWFIRGTSCETGEGLNECLDWVIDNLNYRKISQKKNTFKKSA